MEQKYSTVPEALEELRAGKIILVTDDPDRENEGDMICAAEFATCENINFMACHARGLICTPMSAAVASRLGLPQMFLKIQTITVLPLPCPWTTKIPPPASPPRRGDTLCENARIPPRFPGICGAPAMSSPLVSRKGGVLVRNGPHRGHGRSHAAGRADGVRGLLRGHGGGRYHDAHSGLWKLAEKYGLKFITIRELQDYCRIHEKHVVREACADMPTCYGHFRIYGYINNITGEHHVALVKGEIGDGENLLWPGAFGMSYRGYLRLFAL